MDLRQIRYFVAVADSGSFTRGAGLAFVTQPTLSAGIGKLEAELGVALFQRLARGARLTAEGQRFLPRARSILREMHEARTELRDPVGGARLRLGILATVPSARWLPVAAALAGLAPEISWRFSEGRADEIEGWLAAGKIDLAVTLLPPEPGEAGRDIALFADHQQLAMSKAHPFAHSAVLAPAALEGQPLIARIHCEALTQARRLFDRFQIKPTIIHRTRHDAWALAMVAAGIGVCLIPDSFMCDGVVLRPIAGIDLSRRIGLRPAHGPGARAQAMTVGALLERFDAALLPF